MATPTATPKRARRVNNNNTFRHNTRHPIHYSARLPTKNYHQPEKLLPSTLSKSTHHRLKQKRPPTMPTFTVPDDDSDMSDVCEPDMAMDIEGDSFEEQIDGKTRVQSDPNWQAQAAIDMQYQQNANTFTHQQEAAPAQQPFSTSSKYNFRPARLNRDRAPYSFHEHNLQIRNSRPPTAIGKRKRSESQPPARDTYHSSPDTVLRRVNIMIITVYTTFASLCANAWSWVRGRSASNAKEEEVYAVETDQSGRKRRVVSSNDFTAPPAWSSPENMATTGHIQGDMKAPSTHSTPGAFPGTSALTPDYSDESAEETKEIRNHHNSELKNTHFRRRAATTNPPVVSSVVGQPKEIKKGGKSNDADMPNLHEYTDTHLGGINSVEPTVEEMRQIFNGRTGVMTHEDWDMAATAKREQRRARDSMEFHEWAARKDAEKRQEELYFWRREEISTLGDRQSAKNAAAEVKFAEYEDEDELRVVELEHRLRHAEGRCEHNAIYQKIHEYDGLQAHNTAKVVEAEVARDKEEYNNNKSPETHRTFQRASPFSKFGSKKRRPIGGRATEVGKQPMPVAAANRNGNSKGRATAPNEDASRPTTSSHKTASYKGGLMPSPENNAPGQNRQQAWSWDRTMQPGKPLLRSKSQSKAEQKDQQIDALIDRSKRISILSPQEQRVKDWMQEARVSRREQWEVHTRDVARQKTKFTVDRQQERLLAEESLKRAKSDWELKRREDDAKKQAEEEERRIAEELVKQKAIEDERARQAAEEAARLKVEEEAAAAEKARKEAEEAAADYARKQILIRPLDPHWAECVQTKMDTKDRNTVLTTSLEGNDLRRHDFGSLLPQEGTSDDSSGWLNDEIVNAFIKCIVIRKQEQTEYARGAPKGPPFACYNSGWYTSVTKKGGKGVREIQNWSRRQGIQGARLLDAETIFFPINTGGHWQLLLIHPRRREIAFLDSLRRKSDKYFALARQWLAMELGEKLYKADEWTESAQRSSAQTNTNDCGVFVAMNGLAAAKGYPYEDVSAAKMKDARRMVAAVLLNGGFRGDWEL